MATVGRYAIFFFSSSSFLMPPNLSHSYLPCLQYAINWSTQWGSKNPTSLVRRRKWTRTRMRLPLILTSENLLPKVPVDVPKSRKISVFDNEGTFSGFYLL